MKIEIQIRFNCLTYLINIIKIAIKMVKTLKMFLLELSLLMSAYYNLTMNTDQ